MRRGGLMLLLGAGVALEAAACTIGEKTIAVAPSQVVVHAVLDPGATELEVLVERTLSGSVLINDHLRFDALDPINTGDGVPVTKAQVSISGPDGIFAGTEIRYAGKPAAYGAGRYVLPIDPVKSPIRPGAQYTLTVRTTDGTVVTGTTVVPDAPPFTQIKGAPPVSFNRDLDTLDLTWRAVPSARTYGLRVEAPFGAFLLFSDTTHLELSGGFRNLFTSELERLFIPGFRQAYTVFAVDINYFDYYRSSNDPFTGSGIINHLQGGLGLFGSAVVIGGQTLDVTQQPVDPALEGDYELAQGPPMTKPFVDVMRLYIETPGPTFASLSGWYSRDRTLTARDGIAGTRDGPRIELQILVNQDSRQHLATFVGTQVGDSLVGAYNNWDGRVVFRKRATP